MARVLYYLVGTALIVAAVTLGGDTLLDLLFRISDAWM